MKPSSGSSPYSLAGWLAAELKELGVTDVFLLPGFHIAELCHELEKIGGVKLHCARHEQACGYMAMGYSIAKKKLGIFAAIPGPGILNVSSALASAHACNTPVVGIVGLVSSEAENRNIGVLHQVPAQLEMFSGICRQVATLSVRNSPQTTFRAAVNASLSPLPGPVLVGLPIDQGYLSLDQETGADLHSHLPNSEASPGSHDIDSAFSCLSTAKNPLIIAGAGAENSIQDLRKLATLLGAPLVTSVNLRARINNTEDFFAHPFTLREYLKTADVVLAVGTRLIDFWSLDYSSFKFKLIRIDICYERLNQPYPCDFPLHGKAEFILRDWEKVLPETREPWLSQLRISELNREVTNRLTQCALHSAYARAIVEVLPHEAIVAVDSTQFGYYWMYFYNPGHHGRTITTGYMGSLGSALPLALGAKVAAPEKTVVAICGDGGLMMSIQELATGIESGLGIIILLFDDGGYGEVRKLRDTKFPMLSAGVELVNPDFKLIAESYAVDYYKPENPEQTAAALGNAIEKGSLAIIHICADMQLDLRSLML